jgi:hypothetical protein
MVQMLSYSQAQMFSVPLCTFHCQIQGEQERRSRHIRELACWSSLVSGLVSVSTGDYFYSTAS